MPYPAFPALKRARFRAGFVAGVLLISNGSAQTDSTADSRAVQQMSGNSGTPNPSSPPRLENERPPLSPSTGTNDIWITAITFYPPTPPLYGGVLPEPPNNTTIVNGRPLAAPDELADFVGETFYPALGTRTYQGKVSRKLESALAAYRTARNALLDELMTELVRLGTASRAEREAALRTFAPTQTARIEALERDAEHLRRELTEGGLFSSSISTAIAESRRWRLGNAIVANPPAKHDAEHHVSRTIAYFQEGLLIEQRGLLLEVAMESAHSAHVARGRRVMSDHDPAASFFSPEMARMRLPTPLSPALSAQVARFNMEKAALKKELLEAVVVSDSFTAGKRHARFTGLVTSQKSRIATLETEAEEIRRGLDALGDPPPPWVPPISPDLRSRIESYNRDRAVIFTAHGNAQRQAVLEATRVTPADPAETRAAAMSRRMQTLRDASRRFEEEHAEEIEAMQQRYQRIRRDLAEVARGIKDPQTKREMNVETMLDAHRVAMQRFDTIGREEAMYERYKYAMLQPGLSPGQRRLLFRAGHASLAQALPQGEASLPGSSRPRAAY